MVTTVRSKYKVLLSMLIILVVLLSLNRFIFDKKNKELVTFGVTAIAFSSDPLDYDYYTHHYAFSSIFAKLISAEKNGEIFPMIASSWSHQDEFKIWKFKIRSDLTYSNGDKILIEDVKLNFQRLAFLSNQKKSRSGILEFLEGFDKIKNIKNDFPGIRVEGKEIIFNFIKPMPDLLTKISFGFYGIAHPSLFDQETGDWIDKRKVISSGPYEVVSWNDNSFEIKLRPESQFYKVENPIKRLSFFVFTKIKDASELRKIDFLVAEKKSLLVNAEFEYVGSAENLKIGYAEVYSASRKGHPLTDVKIRRWLRYKFYSGLSKSNFPVTNSFFPITLKGLSPFPLIEFKNKPEFEKFTLFSHKIRFSAKLQENNHKMGVVDHFTEALNALGDNSGVKLVLDSRDNFESYDVIITGTGIEASDYWDTVKFMFLSKEGIKLPDLTGKIKSELKKENPDINFINQEMWDQAAIWPIRHYSGGYWFNKKSNIDYSEMNFNSPAIDFQFLKWKD